MKPVKMTSEEYLSHCEDYDGVCTQCGAIRYGDTEPDAEEYNCDECGLDAVQGIENAMIDGNIIIVDLDNPLN